MSESNPTSPLTVETLELAPRLYVWYDVWCPAYGGTILSVVAFSPESAREHVASGIFERDYGVGIQNPRVPSTDPGRDPDESFAIGEPVWYMHSE